MPIAPAVKIYEQAWGETAETRAKPLENFLTWEDLHENFDQDPREIYKNDGGKPLTCLNSWCGQRGWEALQGKNLTQSGILKIALRGRHGTLHLQCSYSRTSCERSN